MAAPPGFAGSRPEQVDTAHAAGVAAGGTTCEDPPGWRGEPGAGGLYLAYLRDPHGPQAVPGAFPPKAALGVEDPRVGHGRGRVKD